MLIVRFKLLAAAWLCAGATAAHASISPEAVLDPNRVSVVSTTAGGSIALAGFQASVNLVGSRFDAGTLGTLGSSHLGGRVSGAFFGPVGASPGVIDLTSPGQLDTPGAGRYAAPILLLKPGASPLSPVPEPSTWALMLAGLGLVAFAHRRRA